MAQPYAVGEDADVLAQAALLVEHVAAHMRVTASSASPTVPPSAVIGPSGTTWRSHEVKWSSAIIFSVAATCSFPSPLGCDSRIVYIDARR